jgi:hypothetical protein
MLIATTADSLIQKYTYNCTASLLHLLAFFGHQGGIKKKKRVMNCGVKTQILKLYKND